MDDKFVKVVVGLALESALVLKRDIRTLIALYSDPDLGRAREIHDQLIESRDHYDRVVAIWLEPMLEFGPLKSDPKGLVKEMREMEFVLYLLTNRVGEAQREVNDWMNYIANASQSIEDDFWIDAKILLSRAVQSSQHPSVEKLKADPSLRYEVDVLQRATVSYFEEVKGYPLRLNVPEDRLEVVLMIQEIMFEMMQIHHGVEQGNYAEITRPQIHRLSTAIRYLMDAKKELEATKREVQLAAEYLEMRLNEIVDKEIRGLIGVYNEKIKELINTL